jgi:hypothetical protein
VLIGAVLAVGDATSLHFAHKESPLVFLAYRWEVIRWLRLALTFMSQFHVPIPRLSVERPHIQLLPPRQCQNIARLRTGDAY